LIFEQAHGMHGVTLQTPPHSDLFADFHGPAVAKSNQTFPAIANGSNMAPAAPATPAMFMPPPYMFPSPWFAPPSIPYSNFPQGGLPATPTPQHFAPATSPLSRAEKHDLPSSDPPEDAFLEPYPEIGGFLTGLAIANPKRKLTKYVDLFEQHDYYNVDDLANITLERLTVDPFNMTAGNAEFLLKSIGKEIMRVIQIRKKDHKRRRY
jgi:hypothetical protein